MISHIYLTSLATREILRWVKNDIQTLYSCTLVDKLWSNGAINFLYRDPCELIMHKNCVNKPAKSVVKLLRSLEKSMNSGSPDLQYYVHLQAINLSWIEATLDSAYLNSSGYSYGNQVAQLLWSLISHKCSDCLVNLKTCKTSLATLIPNSLPLPCLRTLEVNTETFDEATASVIMRACPNLRHLRISTKTLLGKQLARVITGLGQSKLEDIRVKCTSFTSMYTAVDALTDNHSGSLISISFDVDRFHMNQSDVIEVRNLCQAFRRLSECSNLRKLELRGLTPLNDECMIQIFDGAMHLQQVVLQSLDISSYAWSRLLARSSAQLESLVLHSNEGTITRLLPSLKKYGRELRSLDISSMVLLSQELQATLAYCPKLEKLYLGQLKGVEVKVGDRLVVEILLRCPHIQTLDLGDLQFTSYSLSCLASRSYLKQVTASKSVEKYTKTSNHLFNHKLRFI